MNVVAGSVEQRLDALGALLEAVDEAAQRAEEDAEVVEQVDAGQALEDARRRRSCPRPTTFAARPVGARNTLQRATLEEAGEAVGGVEEVQRVARRRRVEDEDVEAPGAVELVELGHRGELLRARDRAGELLVDAVGEDLVARARRRAPGARRARRRSAWRRASSPTARRASRCRGRRGASGSTRCGSLPSSSTPSALASRRAGSMVTTATRAPSAARPIASAADVVVLPTPPEPAQIDDALAGQAPLSQRRAPARAPGATTPRRRRRSKANGSVATGGSRAAAQALQLAALGRGRARARRRAARTSGTVGRRVAARATSAASKRWASMPLHDDEVDARGRRSSRSASCSASVSLTGISSGRGHRDDARPFGVGEHRVDRYGPGGRCGPRARRRRRSAAR